MKRLIIIILVGLITTCSFTVDAQSRKRTKTRTTKTQLRRTTPEKKSEPTPQQPAQASIVPNVPSKPGEPTFSDPLIAANIDAGHVIGKKLYLTATGHYLQLDPPSRERLINIFAKEYPGMDVIVTVPSGEQECWQTTSGKPICVDTWDNTKLDLTKYQSLQLQTQGESRVFYSIGGLLNYSSGQLNSTLTLQGGTFLYKNLIDLALSLNLGYNKPKDAKGQFVGDVGLSTRIYIPLRMKSVHLAPYVGGGVGWTFAPASSVEPRALAGLCWYVGPGSLDIGGQWGLNSKFSFTFGYTFRPRFSKSRR